MDIVDTEDDFCCSQCDPDDEPGASPALNTSQHQQQTGDPTDPFGSGCLDYVSDSQLNTIALT